MILRGFVKSSGHTTYNVELSPIQLPPQSQDLSTSSLADPEILHVLQAPLSLLILLPSCQRFTADESSVVGSELIVQLDY